MEDRQKEELIRKQQPFNFGIKELKRILSRMDMPKSKKNETIRLYKERLYTRVEEVKAKMKEKGLDSVTASAELDKEKADASNK